MTTVEAFEPEAPLLLIRVARKSVFHGCMLVGIFILSAGELLIVGFIVSKLACGGMVPLRTIKRTLISDAIPEVHSM